MSSGPIRRAQLITPFGVGAMFITKEGISLICCGLDHWYEREDEGKMIDLEEFQIREWRLERLLDVTHFRLPPDYRYYKKNDKPLNAEMTVPFLRFPSWHHCRYCGNLSQHPLTVKGKVKCESCKVKKITSFLVQVQFIAICENGHMRDFPWREWAHKSSTTQCNRQLRLYSTGGSSLGSMIVECDCGSPKQSMSRVMMSENKETELTKILGIRCLGKRPWLADEQGEPCDCQIKGSLRSGSNVYYSKIQSAISLPRGSKNISMELMNILENPPISTLITVLKGLGAVTTDILRGQHRALLNPYSDEMIDAALESISNTEDNQDIMEEESKEFHLKREEYNVFQKERNEEYLKIRQNDLSLYNQKNSDKEINFAKYFSKVMLIDKLKETRVLSGFNRIFPENSNKTINDHKSLLWKDNTQLDSWLPGYVVYGEGIFLELNSSILDNWEKEKKVIERVRILHDKYIHLQEHNRISERIIDPRYILLHTFSHILINQLTFDCGYSTAALKERLYVSSDPKSPMAAILIYTAAGDSEGTMGGLVRMAKPGYLEAVISKALKKAKWCSSDPVCMESGERGGQGPDSCNLAACHSCALVPETACEDFNRFLDRGLLIGSLQDPTIGFFNQKFNIISS